MTNVVYELDLAKLPPLTETQKTQLDALKHREIDYGDIPRLDEGFVGRAVKNPLYKPLKLATTMRLDADVVQWLKSAGKGYQTRANAILRKAMLEAIDA
jgi:uncharacterized protein (DUF4415 family)